MNFKIKRTIAILVGKLLIAVSRLLGKQGTNLPGRVALQIYPQLLQDLSDNVTLDTFIITGTNGKTTTANMIAAIIRESGHDLVHNQAGANMISGITTAFIESTNFNGTRSRDYALLETDEANIPPLLSILTPRFLLISNFFRDQLDRYGELDHTIGLIREAAKFKNIELILNADDPLQSRFEAETGLKCHYYGLGHTAYDTLAGSDSREGRYCLACGCELEYSRFHYAQLGDFNCPNCGNQNHFSDFKGSELKMDAGIQMQINDLNITSPYQGLYNAYNILAAVSMGLLVGFEDSVIQTAIASFHPAAGRQETFLVDGKKVVLMLVKNPTGLNQSLAAVVQDSSSKNLFIALNDNAADGRDISWIWDAEAEIIACPDNRINRFICSGQRSGDMAVRLKYAGINADLIIVQPSLKSAVHQAIELEGQTAYILCTYTALFATRRIITRMHPDKVGDQAYLSQPEAS